MSAGFPPGDVSQLLAMVHRRCCVCHRFCGVKIETDHIQPKAEGGTDEIANAIPLCFECHAEVHSYNNQHPRGRKVRVEELRAHKEQWLQICRENPEILVAATRRADVGPLQALIDELEFNQVIAAHSNSGEDNRGARFQDELFRKAMAHGVISTLDPGLKEVLLDAYANISLASQRVAAELSQSLRDATEGKRSTDARNAIAGVLPKIQAAHEKLLGFLSSPA